MRSHKHRKQKPNFKIDEVVLVLVIAVIAMIVSIYSRPDKTAEMDAEKITETILDDHALSFANNGIVDNSRLKEIQSMNYKDFKDSLNVKNDFCIYLEDENGNIILAKGSSKLSNDGMVCRE